MGKIFKDHSDVYFDDDRISDEFHLYECGYEECLPAKPYEFKPLDYWVVHYCVHGEGYMEIQGQTRHLKAGDLFIIPPFTRNKYYPDLENPWAYRWIGLFGTIVPKYLEKCSFSKESCFLHYKVDNTLENLFESVYDSYRFNHKLQAMGNVFHLLDYLQNHLAVNREDQLTAGEIHFHSILKYIHQNYFNEISVQGIAQEMNIDRTYIFKLFKKYMQISPSQYILRYRLDKASVLLRKTALSITDIGYAMGFNTPAYFSKMFTEYIGTTPSGYRKKYLLEG